jgi:hypothetical protein
MPPLDVLAKLVAIAAAVIATLWIGLQVYSKLLQRDFIRQRFTFDLGLFRAHLRSAKKYLRDPINSVFFLSHLHDERGIIFLVPFTIHSNTGYKNNISVRMRYPERMFVDNTRRLMHNRPARLNVVYKK